MFFGTVCAWNSGPPSSLRACNLLQPLLILSSNCSSDCHSLPLPLFRLGRLFSLEMATFCWMNCIGARPCPCGRMLARPREAVRLACPRSHLRFSRGCRRVLSWGEAAAVGSAQRLSSMAPALAMERQRCGAVMRGSMKQGQSVPSTIIETPQLARCGYGLDEKHGRDTCRGNSRAANMP